MTGYFLGGVLAPLGLSVGFVRRPFAEVREALLTWRRRELGQVVGGWNSSPEDSVPFGNQFFFNLGVLRDQVPAPR